MRSSSRWLLIFGVAIGVIVIVTVVLALVFAPKSDAPHYAADTPEGTVERFLIAIRDGQLEEAYGYTAMERDGERLTYEEWLMRLPDVGERSAWKATIVDSEIEEDRATVEVVFEVFRSRILEDPVDTWREDFRLSLEGNSWLITEQSYLYFLRR